MGVPMVWIQRWNPPIWLLGTELAVSVPNCLTNSGVLQHLALGTVLTISRIFFPPQPDLRDKSQYPHL